MVTVVVRRSISQAFILELHTEAIRHKKRTANHGKFVRWKKNDSNETKSDASPNGMCGGNQVLNIESLLLPMQSSMVVAVSFCEGLFFVTGLGDYFG